MIRVCKSNSRRDRGGAILVLVALLLPALAFLAAMAVDVAWMQLTRTELRTATDAAARAGAKELSASQSIASARNAAINAAARNQVAGTGMRVAPTDVVFGSSQQSSVNGPFVFVPGGTPTNGVRVSGRRTDGSLAGAVPLFFGGLLGTSRFEPTHTATSTVLDRDLCLVLDRSGSMEGSKLASLKRAVAAFLEELDRTFPNEHLGLVSYSTRARVDHTLSTNYAAVRATSDAFVASGNTAIGLALQDGVATVMGSGRRPFAIPTVVLMTDGIHNTGVEPIVPARVAASRGIVVHTVTFGRDADLARMRAVADETGGTHFHATNDRELNEVFRTIARTLPVLLTE